MTSARPSSERPRQIETEVLRVGVEGDGVGSGPDGEALFVRGTLPGERIVARGDGRRATLEAVLTASADRVTPPCPHFGPCGGCALQHWADAPYDTWKTELLSAALARAGYRDVALPPLARTPPRARRRMDLAVRRESGGDVRVGLNEARGNEVVDFRACEVLHPALFALVAPLRAALRSIAGLRRDGSAIANLLDSGPDLLVRAEGDLTAGDRSRLSEFARAHALPRISWAVGRNHPETACLLRPATTRLSGVEVAPGPGAFLQASAEGERAIVQAVLAGVPPKLTAKSRIIELYAGCGTLTFPLALHARVVAFEGDPAAVNALRAAAGGHGLAGRVTATPRDLVRQPLQPTEMRGAAAVVLDPPFAGAAAQMPAIVAAKVERVIYVSCNPATLARDAAVLHDAGYTLTAATAIDQFLWSARLESVSVFARRA